MNQSFEDTRKGNAPNPAFECQCLVFAEHSPGVSLPRRHLSEELAESLSRWGEGLKFLCATSFPEAFELVSRANRALLFFHETYEFPDHKRWPPINGLEREALFERLVGEIDARSIPWMCTYRTEGPTERHTFPTASLQLQLLHMCAGGGGHELEAFFSDAFKHGQPVPLLKY